MVSARLLTSGSGPMQSDANSTDAPNNSANRLTTGRKLYLGSGLPFGRPRCEAKTRRAPRSRASFSVGKVSRIRVSSATRPFSSGTLKSVRTKTRFPESSRSRIESFFIERSVWPGNSVMVSD